MTKLINLISERKYNEAEQELSNKFLDIMEQKLLEMKKATAAKMCEQMGVVGPTQSQKRHTGVIEAADPKEDSATVERGTPQPPKTPENTTVIQKSQPGSTHYKNMQEEELDESDLPVTKKKDKIWVHTHKVSGKEKHMSTSKPTSNEWEVKALEEETLDEARINIVKARIRGGKVQRRKKISNVPGMTLRGGQLKRMSAAERRRRKMGARKAKVKIRAKLSRSLMKRKRSLQKRKSLGL